MKNVIWISSVVVAIFALVVIVLMFDIGRKAPEEYLSISNYRECVDAGYPVMESYPAKCSTPDGKVFTQFVSSSAVKIATSTKSVNIRLSTPRSEEHVKSPLKIVGSARGTWFFEGSFPVELRDGNGLIIAQTPATTKSDWMTTEFIPFEAVLTFTNPTTATGTLIFKKDNPSGDLERDEQLQLPITFSKQ